MWKIIRKTMVRFLIFLGILDRETLGVIRAAILWQHAGDNSETYRQAASEYMEAELNLASAVKRFERKHGKV